MTPEAVTLAHDGIPRRYLLWRGAGPRPPLVVFLHGTGGTAAWADEETGWSARAAAAGFALAVPEGTPPDPEKPPKFLTNPPRWNDGSPWSFNAPGPVPKDEGPRTKDDPDDVGFLAAVIGDALGRTAGDPRRVFLSGFSNGAGMAFRFAAERPDLLAAVAPVAGLNPVRGAVVRPPVPTLTLIGSADPLIPLAGGPVRLPWGHRRVDRPPVAEGLTAWAAGLGCELTPVPADAPPAGIRAEVYPGPIEFRAEVVDGLGHHWPGGKGRLDRRIGGPPGGPDGTDRVWEFFHRNSE